MQTLVMVLSNFEEAEEVSIEVALLEALRMGFQESLS